MKTITDFLQELNDANNSGLDLAYYYKEGMEFDEYQEAIHESICENEIAYYSKAMEFLSENDPSLTYSMELASNLGFSLKSINSELLATLLHQQYLHDEFGEYWEDIENFINEYENI